MEMGVEKRKRSGTGENKPKRAAEKKRICRKYPTVGQHFIELAQPYSNPSML